MKLPLICGQCMKDGLAHISPIASVEFRDDGKYEVTCPKGHKSITLLQQQKFELLFDIGAYAVTDGYYREAVSSFTSSLERFYEFFLKAVLFEKKISQDVFTLAWKRVSNQSERQLGAFIFLYTLEFGQSPILLNDCKIKFRNEVIHKGKIPSRSEAIHYGQAVLDILRPILNETKQKYPNGVSSTIYQHIQNAYGDTPLGTTISTLDIPTIINLHISPNSCEELSLEKVISEFRKG
ncbi:MAG: hypothetical protein JSS37_03780 [Proteobacteria bacterium]|nr:hypothetical protein [Pseudomonadota bacterium]